MFEEWGKQVATLIAGSAIWVGLLKFLGRRELARIDTAVMKAESAADGAKTTEAIDKCIDRLTSLESTKADRVEITAAVTKIEQTLDKHEASRARMYERFEQHASELHSVDKTLSELNGRLAGLQAAGVIPGGLKS